MLAGLVTAFRAAGPPSELEIVALSDRPAETRQTHGIHAAHRYKAGALLRALSRTDVLLSGGGSLLQDVTSAHSIFYYLGVVRLAQMLGKKTMFIAQGIGPLTPAPLAPTGRRRRQPAGRHHRPRLRTRRRCCARSASRARPIEVTADPALLLAPSPVLGAKDRRFRRRPAALAGRTTRDCRPRRRGLRGRPAGHAARCFSPCSRRPTRRIAEQFRPRMASRIRTERPCDVVLAGTGLPPLLENLASCEMVVGMRLHALILAAACGVPSVALSYDPKVAAFMAEQRPGRRRVRFSPADPDALAALLARVWAERAARAEALRARLPALRAQAARNVDVALGLLAS